MAISTTITKAFFEMKMRDFERDGYFIESKGFKPHWHKRLKCLHERPEIVFLVGNKPFRFRVDSSVSIPRDAIPERYRSAVKTSYAYAIKCVKLEDSA